MSYREDFLCPKCYPFGRGELCLKHKPRGLCIKCKKVKAKDYSTDRVCIQCRIVSKPDDGPTDEGAYY